VPPDQVERIANNPTTTIAGTPDGMNVPYFQFDVRMDSPMKHKNVRLAISHAVDWDTIYKELLRGYARRRPVPLDPADDGVHPALPYPAYDPGLAKKLLSEAGYPSGFSFTMFTSTGRWMQDQAVSEAVAAYLAKVGIKATVQPTEWGVYVKMLAERRSGPVFIEGWGSGVFDADQLYDMFGCEPPFSTYCNPSLDELLLKARVEPNVETRRQMYRRAQEMLFEDVAWTGAYQASSMFGINKRVSWKPLIGELLFLWNAGVK